MLTVYPSDRAAAALVLAHGAGGGQTSGFVVRAARELAARGVTVATFDFPYMSAGRSAPDKPAVLEAHWRSVIDEARGRKEFRALPFFIGGKSMGGRIASQVAAAGVEGVSGLVFFGYPLHPPAKPAQRRDAHLPDIKVPMLFLSGTKDPFGTPEEFRELVGGLSRATLELFDGGDHSIQTRKKGEDLVASAIDHAAQWIIGD